MLVILKFFKLNNFLKFDILKSETEYFSEYFNVLNSNFERL